MGNWEDLGLQKAYKSASETSNVGKASHYLSFACLPGLENLETFLNFNEDDLTTTQFIDVVIRPA